MSSTQISGALFPSIRTECHLHTNPAETFVIYREKLPDEKLSNLLRVKRISHATEEILFSCDGRSSVNYIVKIMDKVFGLSKATVINALAWFETLKILEFNKTPSAKPVLPTFGGSRDYFVPLKIYFLPAINSLNPSENAVENDSYLSTFKRIVEVIEEFAFEGVLAVEVIQAENLDDNLAFDFLARISEFYDNVSISTKDLKWIKKNASLLERIKKNNDYVVFSIYLQLDGTRDIQDRKIESISKELTSARLNLKRNVIKVHPVLQRLDENIMKMLHEIHSDAQSTDIYIHALRINDETDYLGDIHACSSLPQESLEKRMFAHYYPEPYPPAIAEFGCGSGYLSILIDLEGNVYPCIFSKPEDKIGNLFEESFEEILSPERLYKPAEEAQSLPSISVSSPHCSHCLFQQQRLSEFNMSVCR